MAYARRGFRRLRNNRRRRAAYRARNKGRKTNLLRKLPIGGFPLSVLARHTYIDNVQVPSSGAGTASNYLFRANSMYDVDFTSTGHQPTNRDIFATIYSQYTVVGAKITVNWPSNAAYNYIAISRLARGNSSTSIINQILEDPDVKPQGKKFVVFNGGSGKMQTTTATYSAKKYTRHTSWEQPENTSSDVGTSPANTSTFVLNNCGYDGSNTPAVWVSVKIDFIVKWSHRIQQVQN